MMAFYNQRIVSNAWIEEMSKSYVSLGEKFGNQDYGYLWWLPHRTPDVIAAIGDGEMYLYNKKENVVIAVTGYFKPLVFDRIEFIEKNILASLIKNKVINIFDFLRKLGCVIY